MNKLAIVISSILIIQSLWSPAIADVIPLTNSENNDVIGAVSGRATIKVIGPLHISEGIVILKDNQISVLSDATDPIQEAELSGELLHAHTVGDGPNRLIKGTAIFTGGYSIKALESSVNNESIQVADGTKYVGRIVDTTSSLLRIKTSSGVIIIPIRKITAINSRRAFEFSIAANDLSTPIASAPNQISFDPTIAPDTTQPMLHTSTVHKQLNETHLKKRLLTSGLVLTGAAACIAIPMGCSLFTQRPNK
jgi:hypothetical protein